MSGLLASDAERDAAVERMRVAAAEGRLDPDELAGRVERALGARTVGELEPLLADLPAAPRRRRAGPARPGRGRAEVRTYLAVMALLVAIWALAGGGYFWPVWPMLGWGSALWMKPCRRRRRPDTLLSR